MRWRCLAARLPSLAAVAVVLLLVLRGSEARQQETLPAAPQPAYQDAYQAIADSVTRATAAVGGVGMPGAGEPGGISSVMMKDAAAASASTAPASAAASAGPAAGAGAGATTPAAGAPGSTEKPLEAAEGKNLELAHVAAEAAGKATTTPHPDLTGMPPLVLRFFWAQDCMFCRESMRALKDALADYSGVNLKLAFVNMDIFQMTSQQLLVKSPGTLVAHVGEDYLDRMWGDQHYEGPKEEYEKFINRCLATMKSIKDGKVSLARLRQLTAMESPLKVTTGVPFVPVSEYFQPLKPGQLYPLQMSVG